MYMRILQANYTVLLQWSKWIDATELEWAWVHGWILLNKWYLLDWGHGFCGSDSCKNSMKIEEVLAKCSRKAMPWNFHWSIKIIWIKMMEENRRSNESYPMHRVAVGWVKAPHASWIFPNTHPQFQSGERLHYQILRGSRCSYAVQNNEQRSAHCGPNGRLGNGETRHLGGCLYMAL